MGRELGHAVMNLCGLDPSAGGTNSVARGKDVVYNKTPLAHRPLALIGDIGSRAESSPVLELGPC